MSFVREFSAPEFFDKALFKNFLDTLKGLGYLSVNDDKRLIFNERLSALASDALQMLPSGIRQAVLQVTLITDEEVASALLALEQSKERKRLKAA